MTNTETEDIFEFLSEYELGDIEQMVMGQLSLYGVIEASDLVAMLVDKLGIDSKKDTENLIDEITSSPLLERLELKIGENVYFVSPHVYNPEAVLDSRERLDVDGYKEFSEEDFLEAGEDPSYPVFDIESARGYKVVEMLRSLGYDDEEIAVEMHFIWENSQFNSDEDSTGNIFSAISDKQDMIESFEEYRDCIDTIVDYANSLPKWNLCGHSADEMEQLKISIKVDEDNASTSEQYQFEAVCSNSPSVGCAWMIFCKSETDASKFKSTVAS